MRIAYIFGAFLLASPLTAQAIERTARSPVDSSADIQRLMLVPSCHPDVPVTVKDGRFVCGTHLAKPKLVLKAMDVIRFKCAGPVDNKDCWNTIAGADVEGFYNHDKYLLKGEWDGCIAFTNTSISASGSGTGQAIAPQTVVEDTTQPRRWWVHRTATTKTWGSITYGDTLAVCYRYE